MLGHSSDQHLRSASAARHQEEVDRLVLERGLYRAIRIAARSKSSICEVSVAAIEGRDLFHDSGVDDRPQFCEVWRNRRPDCRRLLHCLLHRCKLLCLRSQLLSQLLYLHGS